MPVVSSDIVLYARRHSNTRLFLYGASRAMPLLAWALRGDSCKTDVVALLVKPAELKGCTCFSLLGKYYSSLIRHDETSIVDGLLLCLQDKSQRQNPDDFESEAYAAIPVEVTVVGEGRMVDTDVYLWGGERDAVSVDIGIWARSSGGIWMIRLSSSQT